MSLTSGAFLLGLASVALGSLVGAWLLWPRLVAAGWPVGLARAGTLVVVQVTGVALLAGLINAQYDFYPTLPSLFGAVGPTALQGDGRPLAGWTSMDGGDPAVVAESHPVRTPWGDLWSDPRNSTWASGTSLEGDLRGKVSDLTYGELRVWLPTQYDQPAYRQHAFPVVVGLAGFPGNPVAWWKSGFERQAQAAIDDGEVPPFVLVGLNPDPTPSRDTECTDVPNGPHTETFLADDLPTDLTHLLRVAPPGRGWALMGDSAGAYCATKLAMDHPREFPSAVGFGGYFTAISDLTTGNLDGGSAARRRMRDLSWRAAHLPSPPVSLLLTAATGDATTVPDALGFARAARAPMSVTRIVTQGGGHNWPTWSSQYPAVLGWLGQHLTSAPGASRLAAQPIALQRPGGGGTPR